MELNITELTEGLIPGVLCLTLRPEQEGFTHDNARALASVYPLRGRGVRVMVGLVGSFPVGVLIYARDKYDKRWKIYHFMIGSEWQRRGLGRAMLTRLLGEIPRPLVLDVLPQNPARHLYEELGFRPITRKSAGQGKLDYVKLLLKENLLLGENLLLEEKPLLDNTPATPSSTGS